MGQLTASPSAARSEHHGYCDFLDANGRTLGRHVAAGGRGIRSSLGDCSLPTADALAIQVSVVPLAGAWNTVVGRRRPEEAHCWHQNRHSERPTSFRYRRHTTRKARWDCQEQNFGECPEAGYSFVELLVAMGITLSIFGPVHPRQRLADWIQCRERTHR